MKGLEEEEEEEENEVGCSSEVRRSEELLHFNPVIGLLMGRRNIVVDLFMS